MGAAIVNVYSAETDGEGNQYVTRSHLYLGATRQYGREGARLKFLNVDERTEAMFVLYLYHPTEVLADIDRIGGIFP